MPYISQNPPGTLISTYPIGNQWYLNGTAIPGATGTTYVVTSAAGNGSYTVTTSAAGCTSVPSPPVAVVVTAAAASQSAAGLQLWPNPARTTVTVQLPAAAGAATATLTLLDAVGREVRRQAAPLGAAPSRHELPLSNLAAGVYLLRIQLGAATITRRLLVQAD
jgi:hypothetical protein